jgi:hypothetical protein
MLEYTAGARARGRLFVQHGPRAARGAGGVQVRRRSPHRRMAERPRWSLCLLGVATPLVSLVAGCSNVFAMRLGERA